MPDNIKKILIGGILTIIGGMSGAIITGWSQVQLAKQKLNSDLVLKALESSSPEERLESLKFLVETNLIQDKDIQSGVKKYAENKQKNPSTIPQISVVPNLGNPIISNARIYLLAGSKSKEFLFSAYKDELEKAGFKVLNSKILDDNERPSYEEIRFFHLEDKAQAEKIAEFVKFKLSSSKVEAKLYEDDSAKQGYIEIWFGK